MTVRRDSLYGRFVVANSGDKTAILPFKIGVLCNDCLIANWQTDGNLLNGWYLIYTFKYKTKDSRNIISVYSDYTGIIDEYSELNNCLSDTVYVTPSSITRNKYIVDINSKSIATNLTCISIHAPNSFVVDIIDLSGRRFLRREGFGSGLIDLHVIPKGKYMAVLKTDGAELSSNYLSDRILVTLHLARSMYMELVIYGQSLFIGQE